jgi:uncharacterized protein (DUF924 family)
MQGPEAIIEFWFGEHGPDDWFGGKPEFDAVLAGRFSQLHVQVARGEAWQWRANPEGRLAELIVLDQFSRQLHRGSPNAFAQDKMALVLAQEAVASGAIEALGPDRSQFLLMPYMHAESLVIQNEGVQLFAMLDNEDLLKFMTDHRDTIARFGRFPFRNAALGRQSTSEETAYMGARGERAF